MSKYTLLLVLLCLRFSWSQILPSRQRCELRYGPPENDPSKVLVQCRNLRRKWYLCVRKSCTTPKGDFYFKDCKSGFVTGTKFYIWPTDIAANPYNKLINVVAGVYSTTLDGHRTSLVPQDTFYCTWATESDQNAVRPECGKCYEWKNRPGRSGKKP
ncbi:hypothetical protein O181_046348 [Austropuccinia psidii MF-1]|uniref:Secreted protein n=1 Tax=Austropuccinia psidii MF-1 TaxID=1389203 RepID=A0A9Q3HIG5_9BASI|nr:hypothetical protein [Austropuccinia psidii MF-1]